MTKEVEVWLRRRLYKILQEEKLHICPSAGPPVHKGQSKFPSDMPGEAMDRGPEEAEEQALNSTSKADRKLFVGGLPREAKDTDIKEYFGQYGNINDIYRKTDPRTGRSKGFAFIVFESTEGLGDAGAQEAHVIKGK